MNRTRRPLEAAGPQQVSRQRAWAPRPCVCITWLRRKQTNTHALQHLGRLIIAQTSNACHELVIITACAKRIPPVRDFKVIPSNPGCFGECITNTRAWTFWWHLSRTTSCSLVWVRRAALRPRCQPAQKAAELFAFPQHGPLAARSTKSQHPPSALSSNRPRAYGLSSTSGHF